MGTTIQCFSAPSLECYGEAGQRLLRTTAVARRIGRTPRMVRYLAEEGLVAGFKRGKLWFFRETDVA
jgi:hypothetical protein